MPEAVCGICGDPHPYMRSATVSGRAGQVCYPCLGLEIPKEATPPPALPKGNKPPPESLSAAPAGTERQQHQLFMGWIHKLAGTPEKPGEHPELLHLMHTPNEGKRRGKAGAAAVGAGLRRGVPDFTLFLAVGLYVGLVIELKVSGGTVSDDQLRWLNHLEAQGWKALVAWSAAEAFAAVAEYLNLPWRIVQGNLTRK